jgi:hypothetical protein
MSWRPRSPPSSPCPRVPHGPPIRPGPRARTSRTPSCGSTTDASGPRTSRCAVTWARSATCSRCSARPSSPGGSCRKRPHSWCGHRSQGRRDPHPLPTRAAGRAQPAPRRGRPRPGGRHPAGPGEGFAHARCGEGHARGADVRDLFRPPRVETRPLTPGRHPGGKPPRRSGAGFPGKPLLCRGFCFHPRRGKAYCSNLRQEPQPRA